MAEAQIEDEGISVDAVVYDIYAAERAPALGHSLEDQTTSPSFPVGLSQSRAGRHHLRRDIWPADGFDLAWCRFRAATSPTRARVPTTGRLPHDARLQCPTARLFRCRLVQLSHCSVPSSRAPGRPGGVLAVRRRPGSWVHVRAPSIPRWEEFLRVAGGQRHQAEPGRGQLFGCHLFAPDLLREACGSLDALRSRSARFARPITGRYHPSCRRRERIERRAASGQPLECSWIARSGSR